MTQPNVRDILENAVIDSAQGSYDTLGYIVDEKVVAEKALSSLRSLIRAEKQDCGSNVYGCAWNEALDRVLEMLT